MVVWRISKWETIPRKVKMKAGTNLSRFSSIFFCNRQQLELHNYIRHAHSTSILPHGKYKCNLEENSSDQPAALIFAFCSAIE